MAERTDWNPVLRDELAKPYWAELKQFIAAERRDWREDKRPPEEFRPPAMTQYRNGSWVAASGLSPVANAMRDWCDKSRCDFATMLGDNIYPKGATILQMLRHHLGDERFRRAMNAYTTRHAYQNVVTDDLQRAFEQSTGEDFGPFFRQ